MKALLLLAALTLGAPDFRAGGGHHGEHHGEHQGEHHGEHHEGHHSEHHEEHHEHHTEEVDSYAAPGAPVLEPVKTVSGEANAALIIKSYHAMLSYVIRISPIYLRWAVAPLSGELSKATTASWSRSAPKTAASRFIFTTISAHRSTAEAIRIINHYRWEKAKAFQSLFIATSSFGFLLIRQITNWRHKGCTLHRGDIGCCLIVGVCALRKLITNREGIAHSRSWEVHPTIFTMILNYCEGLPRRWSGGMLWWKSGCLQHHRWGEVPNGIPDHHCWQVSTRGNTCLTKTSSR